MHIYIYDYICVYEYKRRRLLPPTPQKRLFFDTTLGPKIKAVWRTQKWLRPSISKKQQCAICGYKTGPVGQADEGFGHVAHSSGWCIFTGAASVRVMRPNLFRDLMPKIGSMGPSTWQSCEQLLSRNIWHTECLRTLLWHLCTKLWRSIRPRSPMYELSLRRGDPTVKRRLKQLWTSKSWTWCRMSSSCLSWMIRCKGSMLGDKSSSHLTLQWTKRMMQVVLLLLRWGERCSAKVTLQVLWVPSASVWTHQSQQKMQIMRWLGKIFWEKEICCYINPLSISGLTTFRMLSACQQMRISQETRRIWQGVLLL